MRIRKNIAISDTGFIFNPTTGDSYSINQVGQEIGRILILVVHQEVDFVDQPKWHEYPIQHNTQR